ncbi:GDSL esterase/lipase At5g03610-like [Cucurbita maxima]|uniref:GDSL esterase/lipase At5g03610-like n=1 Tax=Cucurbita maxima TaxID=3661 RepID=A0A6J1I6N6_CUCMA|nr:GDSL esterase/lipase At5g03610-like [Cucurbita maxima]
MESRKTVFPLLSLFVFSLLLGRGSGRHHVDYRFNSWPTKLFVFGDSYVDTGNIKATNSSSRNLPYGITFPGVPSGRFSDGRVMTDFFANYLELKSPETFIGWRKGGRKGPKYGMNFAFGGTGVFDTSFPFPNMTTQIDFFQGLVANNIFDPKHVGSSVALVSPSGNDYSFYQERNGSMEGLQPFIISVVNQIAVNLKRIQSLGVKKIVVLGLGPVGCLPQPTANSSFKHCNSTTNSMAKVHNLLLKQAVEKLNKDTKGSPFIIFDVYNAILSIIRNKGSPKARARFVTPLKPCCFGVSSEFSCGSVDEKGNKMYTLCKRPKSALFWDSVHPTQQGWFATFSSLASSLKHHL